jgi:adenine-specific DNA-methyltransferase
MATDLKSAEASSGTAEPERLDLRSMDVIEEKRAELLRLFPEARTEGGKIDFDRLRLALGETVDVGRERYGMNWPGKADCFRTIQTPSLGTLMPNRDESVNFDTTENLIIEGDNLEVLKLLQKSYLGKVKMIYIDPPYNTGNDFIYPDNYSESLQTYLEYTGQADEEGRKFGTNLETDGRFHSKWLNMMYPRLSLARNLLAEDGVIFISIDDGESHNLQKLCYDIFGEESRVGTIVWRRRQVADNRNLNNFSHDHEYVIALGRSSAALLGQAKDLTKYSNTDNDPRGPWMSDNLTGLANQHERPNLHYDIVNPETGVAYPPLPSRGWAFERKRMAKLIEDGRILWPAKVSGRPRLKRFLSEIKSEFTGFSSLQDGGLTQDGTRELEQLFGEKLLGFPKPRKLLRNLTKQSCDPAAGCLVLDFFAGSGTTADAVLDLNREDNGNRKFILVQLPEPTGRDDYKTIADITKERVRRVIKNLDEEDAGKLDLNGGKKQDRGFRVFKLAESNFNTWNADTPDAPQALAEQLALHIDHIRPGRTQEDILFEILMKSGYPLTAAIEPLELAGKKVFSVADGSLLVCLEAELTMDVIRAIADRTPERVVCLDAGFRGNDQLKTNAVQIFKTLHRRTNDTKESSDVTVFRTV